MFTKLPKSDVLPKIFVKMTQKIQILLDIFNKSVLRIILSACLHAVVCGNKTSRETKNALYLNEILHEKPCGFPLVRVRGCVLHKQTLTTNVAFSSKESSNKGSKAQIVLRNLESPKPNNVQPLNLKTLNIENSLTNDQPVNLIKSAEYLK